jgi:hypothetical protein
MNSLILGDILEPVFIVLLNNIISEKGEKVASDVEIIPFLQLILKLCNSKKLFKKCAVLGRKNK